MSLPKNLGGSRFMGLEKARFRPLLLPSLTMRGKLAMFLITAFCFFQFQLNLSAWQSDFFSCSLFKRRAFSISIFSSCFFLKDPCRLLLFLSLSETLCTLLFMVVVIFSSSIRFQRYISVYLSSINIFFLPLLRALGRSFKESPEVLGLGFLIRSKWPSRYFQSSLILITFLPWLNPFCISKKLNMD